MINNQNIAVLSEKVAALEAAIKNAGIELPEVTSADNGKTLQVVEGAWATGSLIPGVVNALDSTSTTDALSAAQGKALNEDIKGLIKVKNKTATTTAQGVIGLDLNISEVYCIGIVAYSGSGTYRGEILPATGDGKYYAIIYNLTNSAVTSTEVTIDAFYISKV